MSDKNIDAKQLRDWLHSGEAILIDVREPDEFNARRIAQAMSMPLSQIDQCLGALAHEKRKVVFQCLKGKRGEIAVTKATDYHQDTLDVYNLTDGIEACTSDDFDIIGGQEKTQERLSIQRQVFITVGALVAMFSLLALLDVTLGAFLSFMIGGGLMYAGLSGKCGIALMLQKMPWNN